MKEVITSKTCIKCGVCCIAPKEQDTYCDVTPTDIQRLPKRIVRLHVLGHRHIDHLAAIIDGRTLPYGAIESKFREMKHGPMKSWDVNTCVLLKGDVMHKVRCSVYDVRPDTCRNAVVPGDRACRDLRTKMKRFMEDHKSG